MIDLVWPSGNEQAFIKMASKLGIRALGFLYDDKHKHDANVVASLEKNSPIPLFTVYVGTKQQVAKKFDLQIPMKMTASLIRSSASAFFGLEGTRPYQRQYDSGLDDPHCALLAKHRVAYLIDFSSFSSLDARYVGAALQNISYCRRHGVSLGVASFARDPLQMRNPTDLDALFRCFGAKNVSSALYDLLCVRFDQQELGPGLRQLSNGE